MPQLCTWKPRSVIEDVRVQLLGKIHFELANSQIKIIFNSTPKEIVTHSGTIVPTSTITTLPSTTTTLPSTTITTAVPIVTESTTVKDEVVATPLIVSDQSSSI